MIKFCLFFILLILYSLTYAQQTAKDTSKEKEAIAIAELGGATSFNLKGGAASGYDLAVEMTPIEDWLELELGVSPVFANHSRETDIDLLFKKPWTFSPKVEFMLGVGPAWMHQNSNGTITNGWAGDVAADFMFWPWAKRRFGLYLEPEYEYGFSSEHEQSIGLSAGLLISIR